MRYNEQDHFRAERWNLSRPRNRYQIRKYRRLRRLSKSGIPIDLIQTGGEVVTKIEHGKVTTRAVHSGG